MSDLARLLRLLRPHLPAMAAGVGLGLVVVLANIGLLALAGWFIAAMALAGLGRVSLDVFAPAAAIRALAILRSGGRYGERLTTHDATLRILASLRVWLFCRLEPLAPAGLQGHRSGDLLARLRTDVDSLENLYLRVLAPVLTALIATALMLFYLGWYAPRLALLDAAALAICGVAIPLAAQHLARGPGRRAISARGAMVAGTAEAVRGMGELMIFGASKQQAAVVNGAGDALVVARRKQVQMSAGAGAFSSLVAQGTLIGVLLQLLPLVATGALQRPELPMLALFVLAGFEAVVMLPGALTGLGEIIAAARRIFSLADSEPATREPFDLVPLPTRFWIRIDGLRLRYEADAAWTLDRLDLHVPEGTSLAISGASGSGKTSILNALLRFFDYQEGSIAIGGVPIDLLRGDDVRSLCSVVAQESHLFNASIRDNLLVAAPDANDARLRRALNDAQLLPEIDAMPAGLDTIVGELGTRLSGGQARRLVIARAVLKDAPILLLDEPTEGLDPQAEAQVIEVLVRLMQERTTILISHRPQALCCADAIAVMKDKRLQIVRSRS